jgi:purine-nucleoside phosphorylase
LLIDLNYKYKELLELLQKEAPFIPDLTIVLGSGLGDFAKEVNIIKTLSTTELPRYPASTIQGHNGKIHFAKYDDKNILLFQGRIHFYEGYSLNKCILPVFIAYKLGCKKILLTNAAGGINAGLKPGDLMLHSSLNSIYFKKEMTELIGLASLEAKNKFTDFPSASFSNLIKNAAKKENIELKEGVYWFAKGPSYETPAEIKLIQEFGGDAVGMSTVHEAIFAAYLGMETASISCITNYAAGISPVKLSHDDVTETANLVKSVFERLVKRIISTAL